MARLIIKRDIGPKIAAKMKEIRLKREQAKADNQTANNTLESKETKD